MTTEAPAAPKSGKDLLAKIQPRRNRGRTQLCLRTDLLDRWHAADEALHEKAAKKGTRLSGQGATAKGLEKEAKAVQDLEAEVEAASPWFELVSMDPDRWKELCDDNPPRPGKQIDALLGYDNDAVTDAAIRLCMVDPVFEECEDEDCEHVDAEGNSICGSWQAFKKLLNPSEWEELRRLCREVNGAVTTVPKSLAASSILDRRANASTPPERSAPRRGATTGGSRKSSTSS